MEGGDRQQQDGRHSDDLRVVAVDCRQLVAQQEQSAKLAMMQDKQDHGMMMAERKQDFAEHMAQRQSEQSRERAA